MQARPSRPCGSRKPVTGQAAASNASHTLTKGGYYTLAGESLRKAFLASPMEFSRVTSGFKMRFHPILQTWRAHLGVDYAAPTGTAVRSVGDGVVDFLACKTALATWSSSSTATTALTVYAHLSRINVRTWPERQPGQNVGAVGQTGWATGPHLHFEFRVNGAHVDPLTIARQSESTPVAASAKPAFNRAAAQVRAQLDAAAYMLPGSAQ
jgi:murein DD-endopeptidase MepM/ murein hydrolase activator NlpD